MYEDIAHSMIKGLIRDGFHISKALGKGILTTDSPVLLEKQESPILYLVVVANGESTNLLAHEVFMTEYLAYLKKTLSDQFCTSIICLTVLVDNFAKDDTVDFVYKKEFLPGESIYHVWWYAVADKKEILAGIGQPKKILKIQDIIQSALEHPEESGELPLPNLEETLLQETALELQSGNTYLTLGIFLVNAIILAWMASSGKRDAIISAFGVDAFSVLKLHEYYRILTAVFLHGSVMHLLQNSIYLYFFGTRTELLFGKGDMFLLYFLSGIGGSLASIVGNGSLSIGASGAIFGLMGAVMVYSRKKGKRDIGISYTTMVLLAVVGLLMGFVQTGVDNFAHIGGFFTGAVLAWLLLQMEEQR